MHQCYKENIIHQGSSVLYPIFQNPNHIFVLCINLKHNSPYVSFELIYLIFVQVQEVDIDMLTSSSGSDTVSRSRIMFANCRMNWKNFVSTHFGHRDAITTQIHINDIHQEKPIFDFSSIAHIVKYIISPLYRFLRMVVTTYYPQI